MPYLNAAPMTAALRATPEAFCMHGDYVRHIPSHHDFRFDGDRHVQIRANCGCAGYRIRPDQEPDLIAAYAHWRNEYWLPRAVNREFALHFRRRSSWRQLLVTFTGWLHDLALRPERTPERADDPARETAPAV